MDKQTIINKIRKCLALTGSANEHEAAAALRQAQKLMEIHRVSDTDMLIAGVAEAGVKAGGSRKPAGWEAGLVSMIGMAFGCPIFFRGGSSVGQWIFVGVGTNAEVAAYAFSVLLRQVRKGRAAFIKGECKRLIKTSKVRRADLFCNAWVAAASSKVRAMAGQEGDSEAIDAYMLQHHPSMTKMKLVDRNANRNLRVKDWDAVSAGSAAGTRVQLNRGVGAARPTMIGNAS
jgi:hypothetical protein